MTNEELKKKIESIIRNAKRDFAYCVPEEWAVKVLADALIAAGIGDVSEYKEKLKIHRIFVRKDGGDIKVLYGNNEVDEIVKERNEYKHRVEVAEKAFSNCIENFVKFQYEQKSIQLDNVFLDEVIKKCLQQAEKELAEEGKDD